jgi:hypothetical protein
MTANTEAPRPPRPSGWQLWIVFFTYTALAALIVQTVLLPRVFPGLHAGEGLLSGLDSVTFHELAVAQAEQIRTEGWSAWGLRPRGQAPAGIASAVYALAVPEPWTLIPLNAAVHATAALTLLLIVEAFVGDRRLALIAALPLLVYPSAMTWYAQVHKDGLFILGALLFAYGWLGFARVSASRGEVGVALRSVVWIHLGTILIWVMRPYGVLLLQALGLILASVLTGVFLVRALRAPGRRLLLASIALAMWVTMGTISALAGYGVPIAEEPEFRPPRPIPPLRWQPSDWLPSFLDRRLKGLSVVRDNYRFGYPEAGTNIDTDIGFGTAVDVFAYTPRASLIVLFAPFPTQWISEGATPGGTLMRRVAGLEMIGLYPALALLPYAIWRWRRRIELYLIAGYCLGMMLVYATAVTNIGALYRFRYGFIMTLGALGVAAGLVAWREGRSAAERARLGAESPPHARRDVQERPSTATESGG